MASTIYNLKYTHNTNWILLTIEYIFVITTVLYNSVYSASVTRGSIIIFSVNILWQISLVLILFNSCLYISSYRNKSRLLLFLIIFSILAFTILCINYIRFPFSKILFLKLLIDPLILVSCICLNPQFRSFFFKSFVKVVTLIALISILLWIVASLGVHPTSIINVKWQGVYNTRGLLFFIQVIDPYTYHFFGMSVIRNTSIFFEAPMYSYVLSVSLFFNIFLLNNKHVFNKINLILLLANFSTFSTTGIIFSILAILYFLVLNTQIIHYIFMIVFGIFLFIGVRLIFINKIKSANGNTMSSYEIRNDDILASIRAWKNHILLGNGINNNNAIMKYMNPDRLMPGTTNLGVTTGLFAILAFGGIILFLYYFIPVILPLFFNKFKFLGFSLFNLLILISDYTQFSYIYIIVLSICWSMYLMHYKNIC